MKKLDPKKELETKNAEALAAVPAQDEATKALEEGIAKHRADISAARKERDVNRKRKQGVAFNSKIKE